MVAPPDTGGSLRGRRSVALALGAALPFVPLLALHAVPGLTPLLAPLGVAALVLVLILWERLAPAGRLRGALALTLAAVAVLAAAGWWRSGIQRDAAARAGQIVAEDLHRRADRVQADFFHRLEEMDRPLKEGLDLSGDGLPGAQEAFALLDRIDESVSWLAEGRGLSVYQADGTPLAWKGTSYPTPPELLDSLPPGITHRAVVERHLVRLYGLAPVKGHVLVSEATVFSRLDPRLRGRALPVLQGDDTTQVVLQDVRRGRDGFARHLARHNDRYVGAPQGERETLFVGLRSADASYLGYAKLAAFTLPEILRRADVRHRTWSAVTLLLFACGLGGLVIGSVMRGPAPRARILSLRLATGLAVIWSVRLVLAWLPLSLPLAGTNLFGPAVFASARLSPLMRSPGDLLLTALALLASALVIHRGAVWLAQELRPPARRRLSLAGAVALLLLATASARALPALAGEMVSNAGVNLLAVDLITPSPGALMLQSAALLILLALFQVFHALLAITVAQRGPAWLRTLTLSPGEGTSRWLLASVLPGLMVAALIFEPLFSPASERITEALFEDQLRPEVAGQSEIRLALMHATLDSLRKMSDLADSLEIDERERASLALDLWQRTPLHGAGYSASLRVEDAHGIEVSRFSWNLPPAFDRRARENRTAEPGHPVLEFSNFLDVHRTMLHGTHLVTSQGEVVGSVTVHIVEEFDNLPFLTPETPYVKALAPGARRIPTLPASRSIWHTVYQPDGQAIFTNQRQAPALTADVATLITQPEAGVWVTRDDEGAPARYLFFADGRHLFALGFALTTPLEYVARVLRTMLLGLALLGIGVVPLALWPSPGRWRNVSRRVTLMLGRTQYRKLLTTFAITTLVPVMALAVLMQEYIISEVDQEIEHRGWQAIQSAASLVRTVLVIEDQSELEDDMLSWIGQQVGHDVNLYERGEVTATSRRELFGSGLVSPRLDGEVYREIVLEGRGVAMARRRIREFPYRTITAPVSSRARATVLLSLPLDAQTAEAERRAREVGDVVLITFVSMVVLLGIVGYALARRISRPIRDLRAAASRIAAGDFDATVAARSSDETGDLIQTFNRMARAIKEQREDLERRRDYIEKILLNATIGVISMDRSGMVVTSNPAARALLDEPSLQPGLDLPGLLSRRPPLSPLARLLQRDGERPPGDVELHVPSGAGERTLRSRAVPFLEGQGLILLLEDVTETVRSNRLAAWAEMARRIAHEIKNPLTPIQLSAEHIRRVHAEGHPDFPQVLETCLRTIMDEVASLRQISAEFSTYARIPTPRKERTDMTDFLRRIVRPYQAAMPPGTDLELDIPPDLPALEVDRSLLTRALVNLVENALQAMPRGGVLSVRAWSGQDGLVVEVGDTGMGMDAAAMARLFEPYFSTKDTGTGLGLAIARKAVEEHGGRIEVSSAPQRGTSMRVVLPVVREAGSPPGRPRAGGRVG
jgi:signal transduction histidine kinase